MKLSQALLFIALLAINAPVFADVNVEVQHASPAEAVVTDPDQNIDDDSDLGKGKEDPIIENKANGFDVRKKAVNQ